MATALSDLIVSVRGHLLEALALVRPGAPLVSPQGTPAATTYRYVITATNATGHTAASAVGQTATGAATLTPTNHNQLTWTKVPRATGYAIYRTFPVALAGFVASVGDVDTFNDIGQVAVSSEPPAVNTSGRSTAFWSDDFLFDVMLRGARDLWRGHIDLHQEHFFEVADADTDPPVNLPANASALADVPTNVFRVLLIAPADTTSAGANRDVRFVPADYNSPEFLSALARDPVDPTGPAIIYYAVTDAGPPVGAPTIKTAPRVASAIAAIRLVFIPNLPSDLDLESDNPIPGESDHALVAWTVAHALGLEREDRAPDGNWLAVYKAEKTSIQVVSVPRQEQAPIVVRGVFDDTFGAGLSGDEDD